MAFCNVGCCMTRSGGKASLPRHHQHRQRSKWPGVVKNWRNSGDSEEKIFWIRSQPGLQYEIMAFWRRQPRATVSGYSVQGPAHANLIGLRPGQKFLKARQPTTDKKPLHRHLLRPLSTHSPSGLTQSAFSSLCRCARIA